MINTFIYLALCAFIIWFVQSQKIFGYIFIGNFLKELRNCGICLGFWVCFVMMPAFHVLDFRISYEYLIQWLVLSAVSSIVIFLAREGYISRYGITIV